MPRGHYSWIRHKRGRADKYKKPIRSIFGMVGEENSGGEKRNKAFVSGCFDLLHPGHVRFLEGAARFGDLYVGVATDATVRALKGRSPVFPQNERLYMVEAIRHVKEAVISSGIGELDFMSYLVGLRPDFLLVNHDGDSVLKRCLCQDYGIGYKVLDRTPENGLPSRSTTSLIGEIHIPYRLDLAGAWLDQPFVSEHYPGAVITISIHPIHNFNLRSGMATSTRLRAANLWGGELPVGDPERLARVLFCYDNPPGTKEIAGSQDALGIVMPGLNYLYYNPAAREGTEKYWPDFIRKIYDEETLSWLEAHLQLVPLTPREPGYSVLSDMSINRENARSLSKATDRCWNGIVRKDLREFGAGMTASFEAQGKLFPNTINPEILEKIGDLRSKVYGLGSTGAGGGGYMVLVSDGKIDGAINVSIRRPESAWDGLLPL